MTRGESYLAKFGEENQVKEVDLGVFGGLVDAAGIERPRNLGGRCSRGLLLDLMAEVNDWLTRVRADLEELI